MSMVDGEGRDVMSLSMDDDTDELDASTVRSL